MYIFLYFFYKEIIKFFRTRTFSFDWLRICTSIPFEAASNPLCALAACAYLSNHHLLFNNIIKIQKQTPPIMTWT